MFNALINAPGAAVAAAAAAAAAAAGLPAVAPPVPVFNYPLPSKRAWNHRDFKFLPNFTDRASLSAHFTWIESNQVYNINVGRHNRALKAHYRRWRSAHPLN